MSGLKTTTLAEMRAAVERGESESDPARARAGAPYVWDGQDEAERPLSAEEMRAGVAAWRKGPGRPAGSDKVSTTIRFDKEVIAAFRAAGPGWQTRINAALKDWLKTHSPA